jgi:hypothetical protein
MIGIGINAGGGRTKPPVMPSDPIAAQGRVEFTGGAD